MNQEPVALVSVRYSNEPYTFSQLKMLPNGTHELYTAPRDLTDEEILSLWVQKNKLNGAKDIVDFAKAILKKASEKCQINTADLGMQGAVGLQLYGLHGTVF